MGFALVTSLVPVEMKLESMLKHKIAGLVEQAAVEAQRRGLLPQVGLPEIGVEHPQSAAHGDYACSFPLKLARSARCNPLGKWLRH